MKFDEIRELSRIIWNAIGLRNLSVHVTFWVVVVDCRLMSIDSSCLLGCVNKSPFTVGAVWGFPYFWLTFVSDDRPDYQGDADKFGFIPNGFFLSSLT